MNEKDRHLVTFESSFSYDTDIPEISPEKILKADDDAGLTTTEAPASDGSYAHSGDPAHSGEVSQAAGRVPDLNPEPAGENEGSGSIHTQPESTSSDISSAAAGSANTGYRQDPYGRPAADSQSASTGREPGGNAVLPAGTKDANDMPQVVTEVQTAAQAGWNSYNSSAGSQTAAQPEAGADTQTKPAAGEWTEAKHGQPTGPAHARKTPAVKPARAAKAEKEKKYVTKGVLVAFMIITMIISSVLGALGGMLFTSFYPGRTGTAERNDSKLSELNLSDATGSELTVGQIVDKNENSVVEIVVSGTTENIWGQIQLQQGAGSGVIISKDGYIATNHHVISGADKVEVTLHNGEIFNAKIIGSDAENDIAVIKIDAKDLTPVEIGDSSKVDVGDLAVAIGNPLGQLGGTATTGIISALDRTLTIEGTTLTLIQTDAAINGGNSGGGLFNSRGELIGIVESKASAVGVEGLAFALPINSVAEIINDFIENGGNAAKKATPAVGVVISDISENNAQYYGLSEAGVYIAQITGENAKKAGFQEKDKIVSIDGKKINNSSEFISLVRKHKVGDTVTIIVSRNGQEIEIKTELEELQTDQ